jgi:hypothetical protein
MLWNISGEQTRANIDISASGDNTLIAAVTLGEIFIHEVIGDASAPVTLIIKCGTRQVGKFSLDAGQGLTLDDLPGRYGEPRFKCEPGEAFILNLSTAVTFSGSILYSYRT